MTFEQARNQLMGFRSEWVLGGCMTLFILLLGWVLVTEWMGWRNANTLNQEAPPSLSRKNRNQGSLRGQFQGQDRLSLSPGNIFHASTLDNYLALMAAQRAQAAAEKARQAAVEDERRRALRAESNSVSKTIQTNVAAQVAPKAKPVPPRFVDINFQGMIKMSDGQQFAIIGIAPAGNTLTCMTGEACLGAMVDRVCRDEMALKLPDGEVCVVSRGGVLHIDEKRLYAR